MRGLFHAVAVFLIFATPSLGQRRPPVILVDGYHVVCGGTSIESPRTFGELESRLREAGYDIYFFSHCQFRGRPPIEEMARDLGRLIERIGAPSVDVIAYSMGGLIARAYLAGKRAEPGVFEPPVRHRIRKLVLIATPNFGALFKSRHAAWFLHPQARDMLPGSRFLFDLATWTASGDPLRGVDAIAIAGNGGNYLKRSGASDGLIPVMSASLGFARGPERTRIVPYCHGDVQLALMLDGGCRGLPIAKVKNEEHLTTAIVLSFLSDSTEWRTLGHAASEDEYLQAHAGVMIQARDEVDEPERTRIKSETESLASGSAAHYRDNLPPGTYVFHTRSASLECVLWPGVYRTLVAKPGPWIEAVEIGAGELLIHGEELEGASFKLDGAPLHVVQSSDTLVHIRISGGSGLATLTASSELGRSTVRVMFEPPRETVAVRWNQRVPPRLVAIPSRPSRP